MERPTLYRYQRVGAAFLAIRRRAGIIDEAGLGKSAQAIEAAREIGAHKIAVVCPAVARVNWAREFDLFWPGHPPVLIESYDKLARLRDLRQKWYDAHPDVLIVDEAQYLKAADALRTHAIYGRKLDGRGCILSGASCVWLLSATLAPNSLAEYYTHLRALAPELISNGGAPMTFHQYLDRYAKWSLTRYGPRVHSHQNEAELRAILRTLFLRRTVAKVLPELPPWSWDRVTVDAGNAAAELLRMETCSATVAKLKARIAENDDDFNLNDPMLSLSSLRRVIGQIKAECVAGVLAEELENRAYDKVVVFAHHLNVIAMLASALKDYGAVQLTGSTSEGERTRAIDRFQTDPNSRVFLGQLQACGTAITLNAANHVVFAEQSWVPLENYQAAKRVHRIGQRLPVFVRVFGLAHSIDDAVAGVCARKGALLDQIRLEEECR